MLTPGQVELFNGRFKILVNDPTKTTTRRILQVRDYWSIIAVSESNNTYDIVDAETGQAYRLNVPGSKLLDHMTYLILF